MRVSITVVSALIGAMGIACNGVAAESNSKPQQSMAVSQSSKTQEGKMDRTIGICQMISNPPKPSRYSQNTLQPSGEARFYFRDFEHQSLEGASRTTVLQRPTHGTLIDESSFVRDGVDGPLRDTGETTYYFSAEAGYVGQDSVTLLVEMGGYKVKVVYYFHMFGNVIHDDTALTEKLCPSGEYQWKISVVPHSAVAVG